MYFLLQSNSATVIRFCFKADVSEVYPEILAGRGQKLSLCTRRNTYKYFCKSKLLICDKLWNQCYNLMPDLKYDVSMTFSLYLNSVIILASFHVRFRYLLFVRSDSSLASSKMRFSAHVENRSIVDNYQCRQLLYQLCKNCHFGRSYVELPAFEPEKNLSGYNNMKITFKMTKNTN